MSNTLGRGSHAAKHVPAAGGIRRMRADARRNLDRILAAARDIFADHGPDAPLEEVARSAGVGIGTLYRRFPDRRSLQRAVALDILARGAGSSSDAIRGAECLPGACSIYAPRA
jgi:AcrR family transcriptional regulator